MKPSSSPEFCAAARATIGTDTPDAIAAALRTPLRADIEQVYDDILSGKRAVSFPLSPPAGALSDPHIVRTLEAIEKHHLTIAAARAVMRAQMMARVGERFTAQRGDKKGDAMPTHKAWLPILEDGSVWLYKNDDFKGGEETIHLVRATREQLRDKRPRLYRELEATNYRECPRIVRSPSTLGL